MKPLFAIRMVVLVLFALAPRGAGATGVDSASVPPADPAPCQAAIATDADDRIVSECGALIDNEKTERPDRVNALIARGAVFARRDHLDPAIADYDVALRLEPSQPDLLNSRGGLWWKKGDRPKALADFAAALKLNPDHVAAKSNYRKLALELERLGALMAVAGKPSFNCASARRPVEKAICANPELANLDREINAADVRVVREAKDARERQARQREQDDFIARRNADYGKPGYDLRKIMNERLQSLLGAGGTWK